MATNQALAGLDNLELAGAEPPGGDRAHRLRRRAWQIFWPKALAVAIVLGLWQLVYLDNWRGDTASGIMKGPVQTLPDLWGQLHHLLLWQAIGTTVQSALVGFGLAVLIGSVIGAFVSRIPPLRAAVGSIITGLQTMPSIAWFPFAIIFFGLTNEAILFVVVLGAAPSIANGLIAGVDYTPPLLLRAGKVLGLKRMSLYRHLILPASLPAFVAGLKQGWAFAWRSLMAGELLVAVGGESLGRLLSVSQDSLDTAGAISIMIIILIIGIVVDVIFNSANNRIRRRWGLVDAATGM
jgi:NitT/TauT family transport system permease protein